jgi:hypothetical protein
LKAIGELETGPKSGGWQGVEGLMKVVRLTPPLRIMVPALLVATLPVRTRAVSYEGGRLGISAGALIIAGSLAVGWGLYPVAGLAGGVVFFWLLGGAGILLVLNGARPIAFVKTICAGCRLLPIIREHEAIHLSGVDSDDRVWDEMRTRHSCESLALDGDPSICSFCPIPKRLRGE